jgi:hypothetical protein
MGLTENPLRRRCGAQKETSPHVLRTYETLVTLRHHYLGSFSLDPEDVRNMVQESKWVFIKGQKSHDFDFISKGHEVPVERPKFIGNLQGSITFIIVIGFPETSVTTNRRYISIQQTEDFIYTDAET